MYELNVDLGRPRLLRKLYSNFAGNPVAPTYTAKNSVLYPFLTIPSTKLQYLFTLKLCSFGILVSHGTTPYIQPAARRCIHRDPYCPYDCNRMVRYGERTPRRVTDKRRHGIENQREEDNEEQNCSQSDSELSGVDEVDCTVRSHLQKSFSASRANVRNEERKSETPVKTNGYDDDSFDARQRSNSLPAAPGSNLSYSDGSSPFERNYSRSSNTSNGFTSEDQDRLRHSSVRANLNYRRNYSQTPFGKFVKRCFLGAIISVIIGVLFIKYLPNIRAIYAYDDFKNDISLLGEKYNVHDDMVLLIQTGISTTFKLQDTSSMVFLYDDNKTDEATAKKFVDEAAFASAKFLRNDTTTIKHIIVENSDLSMKTTGELISKYKLNLEDQGVLLVQDLENVPVHLAMAFHYYCDEYNPLVKKTAIFFTLNVAKCHNARDGQSGQTIVENCLSNKWQKIDQDMLPALLNRVASVVVDLRKTRD